MRRSHDPVEPAFDRLPGSHRLHPHHERVRAAGQTGRRDSAFPYPRQQRQEDPIDWTTTRSWLEQRRDLWIDVLRIYPGIGLFIRGLIFFTSGDQLLFHNFAGGEAYAMLSSGFIMHFVVLAHLCGGTLLAFGLLTRLAAAIQVPVLIGAVVVHAPDGVFALGQSLEFAALVLVTLLFIIVAGPGRLSVDHHTFRRKPVVTDEIDTAHPAPAEHRH